MCDFLSTTTTGKRQDELISLDSHYIKTDFAIKQEPFASEDVKTDIEQRLSYSFLEIGKTETNTEFLDCKPSNLECSKEEATANSKAGDGDDNRGDTKTDVILCTPSIKKEEKNKNIDIKTNIYITDAFINNLESSIKRLAAHQACPEASGNMQLFDCHDCDYKGKTQVCLRKHIRYNHRNTTHVYDCSDCEYKTTKQFNLKRHIKYNHSNDFEWHKCNICDYKTKHKAYLQKHVLLKHDEDTKWLACQVCEYKTKNKNSFKLHMIRHNPECHQCQFCDYIGKDKHLLKSHLSRKHNENYAWYQCSFCDYKTKVRQLLRKHFKVKHDENAEWYRCTLCDYKTKLKSSLTEHMKQKHTDWHQCQLCDYKTKFKKYLDLHMECKHIENCKTKMKVIDLVKEVHYRKSYENNETHRCQFCDFESGTKCTSCSNVKQESVNSEDVGKDIEEDNTSSQTGKTDGSTALGDSSQSTVDRVDMQIAVDPEDFQYIVDYGNDHKEDYASDSIFCDENITGDANTKSNTCSENVFIANNDFQSHPTSFKHKGIRNKHSKMYTKVNHTAYKTNGSNDLKGYPGRQYCCLFCEYSANTKKVVNQHVKVKHAEKVKWHQCTLCDYRTELKRLLCQHIRYKHDDNVEWFQCNFCNYKTKSKYYLTKHVKCKHRETCDRDEVFQCALCSFKTHLKDYLANHFKRRSH